MITVKFKNGLQLINPSGKIFQPTDQSEMDGLLEKGWDIDPTHDIQPDVIETITPKKNNRPQSREVYATKDPKEMKKGILKINEGKRVIPTDLAILGKKYKCKSIQFFRKGGETDGYWDTQIECESKVFCVAAQDFHDINLVFYVTVVNKLDLDGNIVDGFKMVSSPN